MHDLYFYTGSFIKINILKNGWSFLGLAYFFTLKTTNMEKLVLLLFAVVVFGAIYLFCRILISRYWRSKLKTEVNTIMMYQNMDSMDTVINLKMKYANHLHLEEMEDILVKYDLEETK